jgi:hypothetical protein
MLYTENYMRNSNKSLSSNLRLILGHVSQKFLEAWQIGFYIQSLNRDEGYNRHQVNHRKIVIVKVKASGRNNDLP